MDVEQFRKYLSGFVWRNDFFQVIQGMGETPRQHDAHQLEMWRAIHQMSEAMQKFDEAHFAQLVRCVVDDHEHVMSLTVDPDKL